MFKSIEAALALYSEIFRAFGMVLMALASLTAKAIPVARNLITTLTTGTQYDGIRVRINRVRDLAIQAIAELALIGRDLEKAAADHPEDFAEAEALGKEIELVMGGFKGQFGTLEAKAIEYVQACAEGQKAFSAWAMESPYHAEMFAAINGEIVEVSMEEFTEILEEEFKVDYAEWPANRWLEDHVGDYAGAAKAVAECKKYHMEHALNRAKRELERDGEYTYKYGDKRYHLVPEAEYVVVSE